MATNPALAPRTFREVNSKKKPVITRAVIAGDTEVANDFVDARSKQELARMRYENNTDSAELLAALDRAKADVEELRQQVGDNALIFRFRAIGTKKYEKLKGEHPATDEVVQRVMEQSPETDPDDIQWDPETFPQALIAKASYDPKMTLEEVQKEIWENDDWNEAEKAELFAKAHEAQVARNVVGLGKG